MSITPANLDALMRLLDEPDADAVDPLIDQIASMAAHDIDRIVSRCESASRVVCENVENALIRSRYRALEPEWQRLKGRDLEQGLILINRTAEETSELDVSAKLDSYADEVGSQLSGDRAFDTGLAVLANVLHREKHLRANTSDYYAPENSYIGRVLETGLGIPISLCAVAILVGRRLELPVHGVGAPGHFLGFYGDVDLRIGHFFDPFDGFHRLTAGEIRLLLSRFVETVEPAQLKPVRDVEILARFLRNLAGAFAQRGQTEHIRNLERWLRVIPA